MSKRTFQSDPRDYALELVEDHGIGAGVLLLASLNYMSHDEVREMLDLNELSPRFMFEEEEEQDEDN
jgi:hypothetical protein